jgi:hypothetical protein
VSGSGGEPRAARDPLCASNTERGPRGPLDARGSDMAYEDDVLGGSDSAVGYEERDRAATGARRLGPAGLLKRRQPGTGTSGNSSRRTPPGPDAGAQHPVRSEPPVFLLPLPPGFEPHRPAS